jgi:hypothetical protein
MQTKRITNATFQAFVRKNAERLYVRTTWQCTSIDDGFRPAEVRVGSDDLEIVGVKLAHHRNFFLPFNDNGLVGYAVLNCFGRFVVAIPA